MDYMTVSETAEKWGLKVRMVNYYCSAGRIAGAVRFNRAWAIPKDAVKPSDGRYKKTREKRGTEARLLQFAPEKDEILAKLVELFPYAIALFTPDGTLIYANEAYFQTFFIIDRTEVLGKMNLLRDEITKNAGVAELAARALRGEIIRIEDHRTPVQDVINRYGDGLLSPMTLYTNLTAFPIWDKNNKLAYMVALIMPTREYYGREEIIKGKEYIENHWQENFDLNAVAGASGLSRTQFTRTFKELAGMTPYEYYLKVKINRLKEKLLDYNLSVSQVFTACGLDYNGYYAKIFKRHAGETPLQYRKNHR